MVGLGVRSQEIGDRRQVLGVGVLGFWGFSSISPLPPATARLSVAERRARSGLPNS
ncbi:hypothetical protein C789_3228 [Microcystis aeruginosa FACHB-905 = DIANCHI905]|nr:hypothetical protein C789_3228 [Microcystis aeruginosa FACHB-905 = DIANCHI905]